MSQLHPHQHTALVETLRDATDAESAFVELSSPAGLKRIGATRFMTQAALDAMPEKHRPTAPVIITDEQAAAFPTGIPGFPNKLRREWFDAAWSEAHP